MCNRFEMYANQIKIDERYRIPNLPERNHDKKEFYPTNDVFMVRLAESGERKAEMRRWGLVASWVKPEKLDEVKKSYLNTNARSETMFEKPTFRSPAKSKRCLIPASAFFEWTGPKGNKTKHRIALQDREIFSFAGLFEDWHDPSDDEAAIHSCTIVTCAPSEWMTTYHHREPVIIPESLEDLWLDPDSTKEELQDAILKPSLETKIAAIVS